MKRVLPDRKGEATSGLKACRQALHRSFQIQTGKIRREKTSAPVKKITLRPRPKQRSKDHAEKVATVKAAKPKRSLITKRKAVKPSVTNAKPCENLPPR